MSTPTQQQTAVAADAAHWDVGGYRVWESTEPGILLYARREPRLATDSAGHAVFALTRVLAWNGVTYQPTSGSASLGFLGVESADAALLLSAQDTWTRVIRANGFQGADPRYLPLPVKDAALSAHLDPAQGAQAGDPAGSTLRLDLTASGAAAWAAAITDGGPVTGAVRLSYAYPRLLPATTAVVRVHGRQVYAGLAARLDAAPDGELSGSAARIRAAWAELARDGALEVSLTGSPASALTAVRDALVEQVRENLFDTMFVDRPATTGPPVHAFRWKRAADVPDLPLTVSVEGWTWLAETIEASVADLLSRVDPGAVHDVHPSVSTAVRVHVDPCEAVESVAVSLDFGDVRPPEVLVFDRTGGVRAVVVTTEHPERLVVRQRTRVDFRAPSWPVVTSEGRVDVADPAVHVSPASWQRRHEVHVIVWDGGIVPWDEDDVLTANSRYEHPALPSPITSSAAVRPDSPAFVTYPVPPGTPPGRCAVDLVGTVGGRLVGASGELGPDDEVAFLVVRGESARLVTSSTPLPESDAIGRRLRGSGARPLVRHELPPGAETGRRLAVGVDVALVPQPTTVSGWAAALAMVVGARDRTRTTAAAVADRAGMDLDESYGWSRIRSAIGAWALVEEGSSAPPPGELAALLREWGPIWVVDTAAPHRGVVVGGITGDGTHDGTWLRLHTPWPPGVGTVEQQTFTQFQQDFGRGPGSGTAMVHG
jgi:hypothetical protein